MAQTEPIPQTKPNDEAHGDLDDRGGRHGRPRRTTVEPRQMHAVSRLIAGKPRKDIAAELGISEKTLGRWLQEPAIRLEFAQQAAAVSAELWILVLAETTEAWTIFQGLLHSENEQIQLRATTWFLDRMLGLISLQQVLDEGPRTLPPMPASLLEQLGGS